MSSPDIPAHKRLWGDVTKLLDEKSTVVFEDTGKAFLAVVERLRDKEAIDFSVHCLDQAVGIFVAQRVSSVQSHLLIYFEHLFLATCDIALFDIFENRSTRFLLPLSRIMDPASRHYEDEYEIVDNRTRQRQLRNHGGGHIRQKVIQRFIEKKGFDQLTAMIKGEVPLCNNEALDMEQFALLLAPFVRSANMLQGDTVKSIVSYVMNQIEKIQPEKLAKEKSDDLFRLYNLFQQVFGGTNRELRHFLLSLASKCFLTKVFPMQKFGLETLIRMTEEAHRNTLNAATSAKNAKGANPDDVFGDEQMAQWLSKNQVLENLFSDAKNTHPALVSKSKDLMEYMMRMNVMTDNQIDLVFRSSLGQHESTRGAIHAVLAELVLSSNVPVDKSRYALQCASAAIRTNRNDVVFFVEKLIECSIRQQEHQHHMSQQSQQRQQMDNNINRKSSSGMGSAYKLQKITELDPKVAESLLDIVWNLLITCESVHDPKRNSLSQYIIDILGNPLLTSLRENYISKCLAQLRSKPALETDASVRQSQVRFLAAYNVLIGIVSLHPATAKTQSSPNLDNGNPSSAKTRLSQDIVGKSNLLTQEFLAETLEQDHQLIDLIIDETGSFESHVNGMDQSDRNFLLQTRLEVLRYFLTRSDKLVLKIEQVKRLWTILENDREVCLHWLRQIVLASLNPTSSIFTCMSKDAIKNFFVDVLCSEKAFADLTEGGFRCFSAFFLVANVSEGILTGETKLSSSSSGAAASNGNSNNQVSNGDSDVDEIVITSCLASSSEKILGFDALWRLVIISSSLRASMMAAGLLLQVQLHMEEIPIENARISFMERVFSFLSSSSSPNNSSQTVNAVRLLSSYLRLYELPTGLDPHEPVRGKDIRLRIQHDETMTHSEADVGKIIEKRFKASGQNYQWFKGYFIAYDRKQDRHRVWFTDGDIKEYDISGMVRVDVAGNMVHPPVVALTTGAVASVPKGDMHYRLLPARVHPSLLKTVTTPTPESAQRASTSYKPIEVTIKERASINLLKSKILQAIYQTSGKESFYYGAKSMVLKVAEPSQNLQLPKRYKLLPNSVIGASSSSQNGTSSSYLGSLLNNETELIVEFIPRSRSAPMSSLSSSNQSPISMIIDEKDSKQQQNIDFFEVLMDIISNSDISISSRAELWEDVLMKIPTNKSILKNLSESNDWVKYLNPKTLLRGIYYLQVAEQLLTDSNQQKEKADTVIGTEFIKKGNLDKACSLLGELTDMEKGEADVWEKTVAFPVLVRVIKICIKEQKSSLPIFSQLVSSLSNLLVMLLDLHPNATSDSISNKYNADDLDAVSGDTLDIIEQILNLDMLLVDKFITKDIPIVEALLAISSASVREKLRKLLLHICLNESNDGKVKAARQLVEEHAAKALELFDMESLETSGPSSADLFQFITELIKKDPNQKMQDSLIDVITNRLIGYHPAIVPASSFDEDETPEQKANAKNSKQYDNILAGFLDLLIVLFQSRRERCSDPKVRDPLLKSIFNSYLIAIPTPDDKKKRALASSFATRSRAFSLLVELARSDSVALEWISSALCDFINTVPYPPVSARSPRAEWSFKADDTRKSVNFLGLVNMGATCYQNSVMQQLFMQPAIRDIILNSYCPEESRGLQSRRGSAQEDQLELSSSVSDKKELFRAMQRTFRYLGDSAKKFFNPRLFVQQSAMLKLTDGHLNQNDAIEFYSRLIDYLDESLKGQKTRQMLQDLLFVKTGSMNMRHCPGSHRTETEVATPFLTLNIRSGMAGPTLHSLQEALESSFKSEKLNGLQCEECNSSLSSKSGSAGAGAGGASSNGSEELKKDARYDADQIKYFARLPKVLVVQLQRFDFDYETMQPTKLNHRVSFEEEIDLTRYTKEETLKQFEKSDTEKEKSDVSEADSPKASTSSSPSPAVSGDKSKKHLYKLQGVVVHQGSGANFGHYYSFIKDRQTGLWFRFDDERVTPFDIRKLDEECFGGLYEAPSAETNPALASSMDKMTGMQPEMTRNTTKYSKMNRSNNAYLLVYERCDADKPHDGNNIFDGADSYSQKPSREIPPIPPLRKIADKKNDKSARFRFGFAESVRAVTTMKKLEARAKVSLQGKKKLLENQAEVWEDNQKTLRNGIGYATDFIDFCYSITNIGASSPATSSLSEETQMKVAQLGFLAFMKMAIRAESQKAKLSDWSRVLRRMMSSHPIIANWFIKHATNDEEAQVKWIESILLRCTDASSCNAFLSVMKEVFAQVAKGSTPSGINQLLSFVELITNISTLIEPTASSQGQITQNSKLDLFKETKGTVLFSLWKELTSIKSEEFRRGMIQRDAIAYLIKFTQTQSVLRDQNAKQLDNDNKDPSMAQMEYTILIEAIVSLLGLSFDDDLSDKGLSALYDLGDKSITQTEERNNYSNQNEFDDGGNELRIKMTLLCERVNYKGGLPLMPKTSKILLLEDEGFLKFLVKVQTPSLAASLLTALICRDDNKKSNFAISNLLDSLNQIQGLISGSNMVTSSTYYYQQLLTTPAGRDLIKKRIKALYLTITSQLLIEDFLSIPRAKVVLDALLKDTLAYVKKVDDLGQANNYALEERYRYRQILTVFVYYTAKLFSVTYSFSDSCRTQLKLLVKQWQGLPEWLDQALYQISPIFKGNSNVYTRAAANGRVVRMLYSALLSAKGNEATKVKFIEPLCAKFEVADAGTPECNGSYVFDGFFEKGVSEQVDTVTPKFVKVSDNGLKLNIYQCKIKGGTYTWYLSRLSNKPGTVNDIDYYCSHQDAQTLHYGQLAVAQMRGVSLPGENNWTTCKEGKKNAPKSIRLQHNKYAPSELPLLGKSYADALKSMKKRSGVSTSAAAVEEENSVDVNDL